MGIKPTDDPASRSPADRLRDALAEMIRQQVAGDAPDALTATMLCQLAKVSRNALYRYHLDVLHALHKAQRQHRHDSGPTKSAVLQLRGENDALRKQVTKLAALVDHYYAAWQENRTLLERRERELADVRRNIKAQVISIRS